MTLRCSDADPQAAWWFVLGFVGTAVLCLPLVLGCNNEPTPPPWPPKIEASKNRCDYAAQRCVGDYAGRYCSHIDESNCDTGPATSSMSGWGNQ